nr:uncharacterized protein LOC123746622 [Procambarus clarkii]
MVFFISLVPPSSHVSSSVLPSLAILALQTLVSVGGSISAHQAASALGYMEPPVRRVITSDSVFSSVSSALENRDLEDLPGVTQPQGPKQRLLSLTEPKPMLQTLYQLISSINALLPIPTVPLKHFTIANVRTKRTTRQRLRSYRSRGMIFLPVSSLNPLEYTKFVIYSKYSQDHNVSGHASERSQGLWFEGSDAVGRPELSDPPSASGDRVSHSHDRSGRQTASKKSKNSLGDVTLRFQENKKTDQMHKLLNSKISDRVKKAVSRGNKKVRMSDNFVSTLVKMYRNIYSKPKGERMTDIDNKTEIKNQLTLRKNPILDTNIKFVMSRVVSNMSVTNYNDMEKDNTSLAGMRGETVARSEAGTMTGVARSEAGTMTGVARREAATMTGVARREAATMTGVARREAATMTGVARSEAATMTGVARKRAGTVTSTARREAGTMTGVARREAGTMTGVARREAGTVTGVARREAGTVTGVARREAGTMTGVARRETGTVTSMARREAGTVTGVARREAGTVTSMARREAGTVTGVARREAGTVKGVARRDAGTMTGVARGGDERVTGVARVIAGAVKITAKLPPSPKGETSAITRREEPQIKTSKGEIVENSECEKKRSKQAVVSGRRGVEEANTPLEHPLRGSSTRPHSKFTVGRVRPYNTELGVARWRQSPSLPYPTDLHQNFLMDKFSSGSDADEASSLLTRTEADVKSQHTRDDSNSSQKQPSASIAGAQEGQTHYKEESHKGEESVLNHKRPIPYQTEIIFDHSEFDSPSGFNIDKIHSNGGQQEKQDRLYHTYRANNIERSGGSRRVQYLKDNASNSAREAATHEASNEYNLQEVPPTGAPHQADREMRDTSASKKPGGGGQTSSVPLLDTEGSVRIPCYVIIFLLGVVGNTLVIVTLLQNRKMRTITNVFLLNLAFSDLLLGVFCMPFTLVGSLLRDFIFGPVMCRLIPYFQAVSVSVSVWTLVAISLERYYAICQPLRSRGWQTLSHAYKIISLVWLLSLAFMAPIAALSQLLPVGDTSRHKCREMWPSLHLERGFSMFLGAGLLLVPLIIMVAAYSSIIISLWHGMRLERETGQGTRSLISLTDLNSLTMVQQSLRRKNSRRHASKISIRFRKIPAQTRACEECGEAGRNSGIELGPVHDPHTQSLDQESGSHTCLHGREYHNYKWQVESVRENGNLASPQGKAPKNGFKRLRSTHLEKSIEAKKHVIKMLFVVVLEFFLCWTPIFVVNIMCLYIPDQVYRALGSFGISFMHLLSYASSCCNPVTYCFMNKKFLQGFRHAFGCRKENERMARGNGTGASFRSQSNNACRLAMEVKRDTRETTV